MYWFWNSSWSKLKSCAAAPARLLVTMQHGVADRWRGWQFRPWHLVNMGDVINYIGLLECGHLETQQSCFLVTSKSPDQQNTCWISTCSGMKIHACREHIFSIYNGWCTCEVPWNPRVEAEFGSAILTVVLAVASLFYRPLCCAMMPRMPTQWICTMQTLQAVYIHCKMLEPSKRKTPTSTSHTIVSQHKPLLHQLQLTMQSVPLLLLCVWCTSVTGRNSLPSSSLETGDCVHSSRVLGPELAAERQRRLLADSTVSQDTVVVVVTWTSVVVFLIFSTSCLLLWCRNTKIREVNTNMKREIGSIRRTRTSAQVCCHALC